MVPEMHQIPWRSPPIPSDLHPFHLSRLYLTIRTDLHSWNRAQLSWFGCVAILKINILPHLLYLFQIIPILLPRQFFSTLHQKFRAFLWQNKHLSIKHATHAPKACQQYRSPGCSKILLGLSPLSRVVNWLVHNTLKNSGALE